MTRMHPSFEPAISLGDWQMGCSVGPNHGCEISVTYLCCVFINPWHCPWYWNSRWICNCAFLSLQGNTVHWSFPLFDVGHLSGHKCGPHWGGIEVTPSMLHIRAKILKCKLQKIDNLLKRYSFIHCDSCVYARSLLLLQWLKEVWRKK